MITAAIVLCLIGCILIGLVCWHILRTGPGTCATNGLLLVTIAVIALNLLGLVFTLLYVATALRDTLSGAG